MRTTKRKHTYITTSGRPDSQHKHMSQPSMNQPIPGTPPQMEEKTYSPYHHKAFTQGFKQETILERQEGQSTVLDGPSDGSDNENAQIIKRRKSYDRIEATDRNVGAGLSDIESGAKEAKSTSGKVKSTAKSGGEKVKGAADKAKRFGRQSAADAIVIGTAEKGQTTKAIAGQATKDSLTKLVLDKYVEKKEKEQARADKLAKEKQIHKEQLRETRKERQAQTAISNQASGHDAKLLNRAEAKPTKQFKPQYMEKKHDAKLLNRAEAKPTKYKPAKPGYDAELL